MEILYPDVVGSGGAPKRVMKPRRKGPDTILGAEDLDTPGTAVLDLAVDPSFTRTGSSGGSGSSSSRPSSSSQQHAPPPPAPLLPSQQQPQPQPSASVPVGA